LVLRDDAPAGVRVLVLNDPARINCLSEAMMLTLKEELEQAGADPTVSVVVLRAAGKNFCSGHDLKEVSTWGQARLQGLFSLCSSVMETARLLPIPVVAAVQGAAHAAGCQLACSCDVVVADETANFCVPGVNIGLFCHTPSVPLLRAVPRKVASKMLFTGTPISVTEALRNGLVSEIAPEGVTVSEAALRIARRIAFAPRELLISGKAGILAQSNLPLGTEAYKAAEGGMCRDMQSSVSTEGIGAFLAKRPPQWKVEQEISQALWLARSGGIGIIGASPKEDRPSHKVMKAMQSYGYRCTPISPKEETLLGERVYRSLGDMIAARGAPAVVDVFREPSAVPAIIDDCIAAMAHGVKAVWLQEGVTSPAAEAAARRAGLVVVSDKCVKIEAERLPGYSSKL